MKKKFYTNLKELRTEKGLSQQELADKVEVRRETIIRLEKGQYNPSLELAMDISKIIGVALEELFSFE